MLLTTTRHNVNTISRKSLYPREFRAKLQREKFSSFFFQLHDPAYFRQNAWQKQEHGVHILCSGMMIADITLPMRRRLQAIKTQHAPFPFLSSNPRSWSIRLWLVIVNDL